MIYNMFDPDRDTHYANIVRSKDRKAMYKYKLIKSIVMDLDEYLKENNLTSIDNESRLLGILNLSNRKHSITLTRYFKVIGYKANVTIDTYDIESWTFKYNWHRKLYADDNDKLTYG